MDIEDPEFMADMKAVGVEIFRCFYAAHCAFDFASTAKAELEGFAEKLRATKRLPELELVNGALETIHRLEIHIELERAGPVK
jgi:hypothetical protein